MKKVIICIHGGKPDIVRGSVGIRGIEDMIDDLETELNR